MNPRKLLRRAHRRGILVVSNVCPPKRAPISRATCQAITRAWVATCFARGKLALYALDRGPDASGARSTSFFELSWAAPDEKTRTATEWWYHHECTYQCTSAPRFAESLDALRFFIAAMHRMPDIATVQKLMLCAEILEQ